MTVPETKRKVPGVGTFFHARYTRKGEKHSTATWSLRFNHNGKHMISLGTADWEEALRIGKKERKATVGKVERHELAGPAENRVKAETLIDLVEQDYKNKDQSSLQRVLDFGTLIWPTSEL